MELIAFMIVYIYVKDTIEKSIVVIQPATANWAIARPNKPLKKTLMAYISKNSMNSFISVLSFFHKLKKTDYNG